MERLWKDVKYGARRLVKSPGFTAVAVVSLALGIAANTTIFSLANALLLRPLPGQNPGELATVHTSDFSGPLYGSSSYPDFVDFREKNATFNSMAAYAIQPLQVTLLDGEGVQATGQMVSGNYFDVLRIRAAYGRTFVAEEDSTPGAHAVALLGYGFWQRRLGSDASIVGKAVAVNGREFTVIGIAAEGFNGLMRGIGTDVWVPLAMSPQLTGRANRLEQRTSRGLQIFGRLKPGVSVEQAQANMSVIAKQMLEAYGREWQNRLHEGRQITVLGESASRVPPAASGAVQVFMVILLVVVGLVLLIACANVANLLLARATGRQKEIAIRLSQGASRGRLVQQLLTESVLLAGIAGAAGVLLAMWTTGLLMAFQPPLPISLDLNLSVDTRVLLFAVMLTLLTGIVFGLAPAVRATRPDVVGMLKDEGAGSAGGYRRSWLRSGLVVGQVAVSLLLLVGAGLLLRSLQGAQAIDPGFEAKNVLLASVDLGSAGHTEQRGQEFYREVQERLEALPGVEVVSTTDRLPLALGGQRRSISIEGYQPAEGEDIEQHFSTVGPGFLEALRVPMVKGRSFTKADTEGAPRVVIVNEAFVRRFWPGQEPLGKWVAIGRSSEPGRPESAMEVIGVAKDGRYISLADDAGPYLFYPEPQNYESAMTLVVRTKGEPTALASALRETVKEVDAGLPVFGMTTLEEYTGVSLLPVRLAATLLGIMGMMALVLAGVGIYGVVAYAVSQRTREIGIRMALGAQTGTILRMVLGQGAMLTGIGLGIGLGLALWATQFMSMLLYGVGPRDLVTFAGVAVVLGGVAVAATLAPALRAARVAPVEALRYE